MSADDEVERREVLCRIGDSLGPSRWHPFKRRAWRQFVRSIHAGAHWTHWQIDTFTVGEEIDPSEVITATTPRGGIAWVERPKWIDDPDV